jgi:hypothetical protein
MRPSASACAESPCTASTVARTGTSSPNIRSPACRLAQVPAARAHHSDRQVHRPSSGNPRGGRSRAPGVVTARASISPVPICLPGAEAGAQAAPRFGRERSPYLGAAANDGSLLAGPATGGRRTHPAFALSGVVGRPPVAGVPMGARPRRGVEARLVLAAPADPAQVGSVAHPDHSSLLSAGSARRWTASRARSCGTMAAEAMPGPARIEREFSGRPACSSPRPPVRPSRCPARFSSALGAQRHRAAAWSSCAARRKPMMSSRRSTPTT